MAENFVVSARKYRPDNWDTVVGQKHITSTLKNAIANNQIAQAYLFTGPRGVGKTTCARIFSKAVNGLLDKEIDDMQFSIFELDAASNNSVEDIRSIVEAVRIPPQGTKYKVYIIDEVHMLSSAAFNAFLKTLEEPPAHAIFILATTEKHKILPTILSRCQIFDFNRIRIQDMVDHLQSIAQKEQIACEPEALHVIAQKADGAMRDALSIFDQLVAFCGRNLTYRDVISNLNVLDYEYYFRLCDFVLEENIPSALVLFNEVTDKGFEGHHFISGLGSHLRNLMVSRDAETTSLMEVAPNVAQRYADQGQKMGLHFLIQALDFVNECDLHYRTSKHPRLLVELTLMKLCSIEYNRREVEKKNFKLKPAKALRSSQEIASEIQKVAIQAPAPLPVRVSERETAVVVEKKSVGGLFAKSKLIAESADSLSIRSIRRDHLEHKEISEQLAIEEEEADKIYPFEQIQSSWKSFCETVLHENKQVQSTFAVAQLRSIDDNKVMVSFPSETQIFYFNEWRPRFAEYLRESANMRGIRFETEVIKLEERPALALSDREKFEALRSKYPVLEELRIKFQLRIE